MKIRIGIYETNSSSSHSFSIGGSGRFSNTLEISKSGIIRIHGDSWYEGPKKTNEAEYKLSYLLCFIDTKCSSKTEAKELRECVYDVVKDFTGARRIIYKEGDETVDHQSLDIIDLRDVRDPEFVKDFVFSEDTWLYLLWDSESPEKEFFESTPENKELYRLCFNFPGIPKEQTTITLDYQDSRSSSRLWRLVDNILSKIGYDPVSGEFKTYNNYSEVPGYYIWAGWVGTTPFEFMDVNDKNKRITVCPEIEIL